MRNLAKWGKRRNNGERKRQRSHRLHRKHSQYQHCNNVEEHNQGNVIDGARGGARGDARPFQHRCDTGGGRGNKAGGGPGNKAVSFTDRCAGVNGHECGRALEARRSDNGSYDNFCCRRRCMAESGQFNNNHFHQHYHNHNQNCTYGQNGVDDASVMKSAVVAEEDKNSRKDSTTPPPIGVSEMKIYRC